MRSLPRPGRRSLVAMVVGTALATLGPAPAVEAAPQAMNQISRYCSACWRNARLPEDRWNDCTQEVFRRLLERVPMGGWNQVLAADSDERREFIRAIDAVKKQTQRDRQRYHTANGDFVPANERRDPSVRDDRDAVDHASQEVLTARQRRILKWSLDGASVAEVAQELKLPAQRVSDEKYKAIQKLRAYFQQ